MHQRHRVWPIVHCAYSQTRFAATVAKTKPRTWDASPEPTISKPISSGKWTLPIASSMQLHNHGGPIGGDNTGPAHHTSFDQRTPLSHIASQSQSTNALKSLNMAQNEQQLSIKNPISFLQSSANPPQISKTPSATALTKWKRHSQPASGTRIKKEENLTHPHSSSNSMPQSGLRPPEYGSHQDSQANIHLSSRNWRPEEHNFRREQSDRIKPAFDLSLHSHTNDHVSRPHTARETRNTPVRPSLVIKPADINGRSLRNTRSHRVSPRERGSLLSGTYEDKIIFSKSKGAPSILNKSKVKKHNFVEKSAPADIYIPTTISVGTLARLLGVRLEYLQRKMRAAGMAEEAKYDYVLTSDYAILLAEEFGRNAIVSDEAAFDIYPPPPCDDSSLLPSRPPIVTIMGHVDHGKTTLLDSLRSASIAKGEAGGITQHIGAFSVPVLARNESPTGLQSITFLDTPGHAAFSAMRARGASMTDIIVLVVAADDGIMPQTKEVIDLIKKDEGKVGVVIAINKVDKPGIDVESVYRALMAENIQLERFGGDIPSVEVSGLSGHGLPDLIEMLSVIAEMQDLRAEREGPAQGFVLESKVHKGLGPVATVLVLRGCLKAGSHIISGTSQAKVRVMSNSTGDRVKAAYPGMAVIVSGWKTLPNAGDDVLQGTESDIKKAIINRLRKVEIQSSLADVEAINLSRRQEQEQRELEIEGINKELSLQDNTKGPKELRLIIKADVSGSAEAVSGALQGLGNKHAITRIISSGVGDISESDIMMAKAVGGIVVGFSVSIPRSIEVLAAQNNVSISSSNVIYRLMDDIKARVVALLPVIIETRVTGEAIVLQLFDIELKAKQTKKVAGCRVVNGIVERNKFAKVVRDGVTIHEGVLDTMRHLKKDVIEARKGSECGLSLSFFTDLRPGDIIQMYEKVEKAGVL